jgi:hypothetical protein
MSVRDAVCSSLDDLDDDDVLGSERRCEIARYIKLLEFITI